MHSKAKTERAFLLATKYKKTDYLDLFTIDGLGSPFLQPVAGKFSNVVLI